MKVTLTGPDDEGNWFLTDCDGNAVLIVEDRADYPFAAILFGWIPNENNDIDEQIDDAFECLLDHVGEQITAPKYIEEGFEE